MLFNLGLLSFRRTLLRYVRFMSSQIRLCRLFVCLSSVTLLRPTHTVELFGNVYAPPSSLYTRGVRIKIVGKIQGVPANSYALYVAMLPFPMTRVTPKLDTRSQCHSTSNNSKMVQYRAIRTVANQQ